MQIDIKSTELFDIKNSIEIWNPKYIRNILNHIRTNFKEEFPDYKFKRSLNSWCREWHSHNLLYYLGLYRSHCIDTGISEYESNYRKFWYCILSVIYLFSWRILKFIMEDIVNINKENKECLKK